MLRRLAALLRWTVALQLLLVDFCLTAPVLNLHRWFWPVTRPEMSGGWAGWVSYWFRDNALQTVRLGSALWKARPLAWWLYQVPWAILIGLTLFGNVRTLASITAYRRRVGTVHGSSRWRTTKELRSTLASINTDKPQRSGIVVSSTGSRAWVTRPEALSPHVLVLGATRSGKTRRVILPSVYVLGHHRESMVLTDPKGELYRHTASWLKGQGYKVVLIDLDNPKRGNRWNPLTPIREAWLKGDSDTASKLAWELGSILTPRAEKADPIWAQTQEALTAAMALLVGTEAPDESAHMPSAYKVLRDLGASDELDQLFNSLPEDHPAKDAFGSVGLSQDRLRSSILTGTAAQLRLFGEPGIVWLCSVSDHDLSAIGQTPTAVFIRLSETAAARAPLATLYVSQVYSSLAATFLKVPVWFLLDEVGNIPPLPHFDRMISVAAGRGIRFVLAVQDLSQLQATYGQRARTIHANCGTTVFLRTQDPMTAQVISSMTGQVTVSTLSRSQSSARETLSEGTTGRALLMPDEVLRWSNTHALVLQAEQYPAKLPLADLSAWTAASRLFTPEGGENAACQHPCPSADVTYWRPAQRIERSAPDLSEIFETNPKGD